MIPDHIQLTLRILFLVGICSLFGCTSVPKEWEVEHREGLLNGKRGYACLKVNNREPILIFIDNAISSTVDIEQRKADRLIEGKFRAWESSTTKVSITPETGGATATTTMAIDVPWSCHTPDGRKGYLYAKATTYKLKKGRVFFINFKRTGLTITQEKLDLPPFQMTNEGIAKLADTNLTIREFLQK